MARHVRLQPAGAGQFSYDVTSEVAMTGENLALLNQGTFCITLDTGAVYEAYPTGTTPPAGAITITAMNGVWVLASSTGGAPGTPAYNPTWYAAANIYVDPANSTGLASDANAGTSAITPLLTFGQIVQRWGSSSPQLAVSTTIHQMSSQGAGDPVILSPIMSAGTNFALVGTTVAAGAPFSPGSVTPKVRGNPGTLLQLTAMPAGSAAGQLVQNVTKNSYAFIDSMAAAVATMTQPLAASGLFTIDPTQVYAEDDTWAAGDTYQRLTLPTTNLKIFDVSGGDSTAGYTAPIGWLQTVHVVDVSGVGGNSVFAPRLVDGNNMTISSCQIDPQLYFDCSDGPYSGFVAGSWVPNGSYLRAAIMMGGAANTTLNANGILLEDLASVDGDAILHGPVVIKGGRYCIFGLAYADASIVMAHGGGVLIEPDILATGHLWGATTINLEGTNSSVINGSGGTWATCLTVGQLSLEGANTGSAYSLGTYVDGIALTSANLDSYNGLSNPITGSRFASLSTPTSTGGGLSFLDSPPPP